jgi:DNA-binding transcriptional LysR family regulator
MQWHERIRSRLKLRELHTLEAVVQSGSMAKAATYLGLSQSAVSKSITEMEHTLGVPLLDRTSRGVEPTAYARILLKRSIAIFDELSQGLKEIEYLTDPTSGELRIGTTEPMTAIVATVIDRLSRQYPRMIFHVMVNGSTTLLFSELRERNLDLAISRMAVPGYGNDLKGETLFHDPLVVMTGSTIPGFAVAISNFPIWWASLDTAAEHIPLASLWRRHSVREVLLFQDRRHHVFGSYASQHAGHGEVRGDASERHALVPNLSWIAKSAAHRLTRDAQANRSGHTEEARSRPGGKTVRRLRPRGRPLANNS